MVIIKRVTDIAYRFCNRPYHDRHYHGFLAPILLHESKGYLSSCREERVSRDAFFKMYKFRSMYTDAEEHKGELRENEMNGLLFKVENDPRVTKGPDVLSWDLPR